jgi:hypothetical protein
MDFENQVSINDKPVLEGKTDLLSDIANIFIEEGIKFRYEPEFIECYDNKRSSDDIISILRSRVSCSLLVLEFFISTRYDGERLRFIRRNKAST